MIFLLDKNMFNNCGDLLKQDKNVLDALEPINLFSRLWLREKQFINTQYFSILYQL